MLAELRLVSLFLMVNKETLRRGMRHRELLNFYLSAYEKWTAVNSLVS